MIFLQPNLVLKVSFHLVLIFAYSCQSEQPVQETGNSSNNNNNNRYSNDQQSNCLNITGTATSDTIPSLKLIYSPLGGNKYEFCSATSVSHNLIVTAAHCIVDTALINPTTYYLPVRKVENRTVASQALGSRIQALQVWRDNDMRTGTFNPLSKDHQRRDVAYLLFPDNTFSDFTPVATNFPSTGSQVTIAGFGATSWAHIDDFFGGGGFQPRRANHTLSSSGNGLPSSFFRNVFHFSGNQGMPLQGDSGGPMFFDNKIVGVFSVSNERQASYLFGIYTPLNNTSNLSLMQSVVNAGHPIGDPGSGSTNNTGPQGTPSPVGTTPGNQPVDQTVSWQQNGVTIPGQPQNQNGFNQNCGPSKR